MRKNFLIKYILIILVLLFILTGCSVDNEKTIQDKVNEEINFLENKTFTITNKYAKGEYLEDSKLNWNDISKEVEEINISIDTIIQDLSELDISNEDILALRNEVNSLIISAGNEDEYNLLQRISYLYSLLPNYLEKYSDNKNKVDVMKLKGLVLSSFVQANFLEWDTAKSTIVLAEAKYNEMMNNVDYMKEYSNNLNKIYVLLEELKNAIELEEVELTKVKFVNFIEKY